MSPLYDVKLKTGHRLQLVKLHVDTHLDILHKWHHQDFVAEYWEMNFAKEEILKTLEKLPETTLSVIALIDSRPIGYFEYYRAKTDRIAPFCDPEEDDRGVHLLIGEKSVLRKGLAREIIFHATKWCFEDDQKMKTLWGEPRHDNEKIMAVADDLPGWELLHTFDFPHKKARLLRCERENFYREAFHE